MATLFLKARRRRFPRLAAVLLASLLLSGCSSLFFYPMKPWAQNPARLGLAYQDVVLIEADGTRIDGWWLPASAPLKGTVYYLHGNAQNISTHIMNVAWLPAAGYQVLLIDYRGYGLSDGEPSLDGAMTDIQTGLDWLKASDRQGKLPLIVYGQSLGASMATWVLAQKKNRGKADCFIEEAGFADYQGIVNDVMKKSWLLWPLRPLVVPFINDHYAPAKVIGQLAPMPLLVIHSRDDQVVPFAQGQALFAAAAEPKAFYDIGGNHAEGPKNAEVRKRMLQFMGECGTTAKEQGQWRF